MLIVIGVAFSAFMTRLNHYIVNVSLPTMSDYFNVGTSTISFVMLSFFFTLTGSLLLFGWLGDRVGLKKVFIGGYVVTIVGSFMCGLSTNIYMLIAFRMVHGIGGAMLLASGYAIIPKALPHNRVGSAFGVLAAAGGMGIAAGAPLGGIITGWLSWRWIFFVNVIVGLAAVFIAARHIPGKTPKERSEKSNSETFDLPGMFLSVAGLAALLFGLHMGKVSGWASFSAITGLALFCILLWFFVIREKRCSSPLLDLTLFKNKTFTYALLATFASQLILTGNSFLVPFYLQIYQGLSTAQTGMVLFIYALIYVFFAPIAGKLSDTVISPRMLCTMAMASAAACAFVFVFTLRLHGLANVFVFLIWLALSYVLFNAPNNRQIMTSAAAGTHGSASGLLNTVLNVSALFGVVLFETVFSLTISGGTHHGDINPLRANLPIPVLLRGFSAAYISGGIVCFAAFLFSLAAKEKRG